MLIGNKSLIEMSKERNIENKKYRVKITLKVSAVRLLKAL